MECSVGLLFVLDYFIIVHENLHFLVKVCKALTVTFLMMLIYANVYPNIIILLDTAKGNNKKLFNITETAMSFSQVHHSVLLAIHVFTGWDSTSSIKDSGKVRLLGIHQKSPEYEEVFSKFGDTWSVSEDIMTKLEGLFMRCVWQTEDERCQYCIFYED